MRTANVSREALAVANEMNFAAAHAVYRSPKRTAQANRTRMSIIGAALALIAEGNFRPPQVEVARRAGVPPSSVGYHFGALELLYVVLAREHADTIAGLAGLDDSIPADRKADLVWLIMTGTTRRNHDLRVQRIAAGMRGGAL